jgi:RNA polymerase sigma factor (sigma-70 family)
MKWPETNAEWATLVAAALRGKEEAIRALADPLAKLAYAFLRAKGLSPADAEDLGVTCVTDTVLKLPQFKGGSFKAWAWRIFDNKLKDYYRCRPPLVPWTEADDQKHSPERRRSGLSDRGARAAVNEALCRLCNDDRLVLELRHGREPLAFKMIGQELAVSPATARKRYERARQKVETALRKDQRMLNWLEHRISPGPTQSNPKTVTEYENTDE